MDSKIYYIIMTQLIILVLIKLYAHILLKRDNTSKECVDIFNKTIYNLKICGWNISHIIVFYMYCVILKPITFINHTTIFLIGVLWYILQHITSGNSSGNIIDCPEVVYNNMIHPKLDDFIFNIAGQLIYIATHNWV